jgi:hypothetical protein
MGMERVACFAACAAAVLLSVMIRSTANRVSSPAIVWNWLSVPWGVNRHSIAIVWPST